MRLVNVDSLELEEFIGDPPVEYAILSHTWNSEEVSFQEWASPSARQKKKGYSKIFDACAQARLDRVHYLWVDTNCIDKSSSAELSEAINSMYAWYLNSAVCYGYLEDVPSQTVEQCNEPDSLFMRSRWFTRGWTLQELIAPQKFIFYSKTWVPLGARQSLVQAIHKVTRIDRSCLILGFNRDHYSIAERMSWASDRVTTRPEDTAYCLLGLFDVNIPLLYGEGSKAFIRLQEEILRTSDDQSLLSWGSTTGINGLLPVLSPSPNEFGVSRLSRTISDSHKRLFQADVSLPFSMTNVGLSMTIPRVMTLQSDLSLVVLNYRELLVHYFTGEKYLLRTLIPVKACGGDRYVRVALPRLIVPVPFQRASTRPDLSTPLSSHGTVFAAQGNHLGLSSIIMVNSRRAGGITIGPAQERDFSFAFMPIFPVGLGHWELAAVHPPDSLRQEIGMLVPRSQTQAVALSFSKRINGAATQGYLSILLTAPTRSSLGILCKIRENVPPNENLEDVFARELKLNMELHMKFPPYQEYVHVHQEPAAVDELLVSKYDLHPSFRHQIVREDQEGSCSVKVSFSVQNLVNGQLVAPVEITFRDIPE